MYATGLETKAGNKMTTCGKPDNCQTDDGTLIPISMQQLTQVWVQGYKERHEVFKKKKSNHYLYNTNTSLKKKKTKNYVKMLTMITSDRRSYS